MSFYFHHIHLLCSDLEKTIAFFCDILDSSLVCHKKFGGADGATLDLNGTMINLRIATETEKIVGDSSVMTFGYHHICVRTKDVDEAYKDLTARGVEFISPPAEASGNRISFFKGPDNISIELLQPLDTGSK